MSCVGLIRRVGVASKYLGFLMFCGREQANEPTCYS